MSQNQMLSSRTARALALLGDHWTLLILIQIFRSVNRYQDLKEVLQISDSILSSRLRTLVDGGLLVKEPYTNGRIRYEYRLTKSGRSTWRILLAAWEWERNWLREASHKDPDVLHLKCGHNVGIVMSCGKCNLPIRFGETSVKLNRPTLSYVGSVPRRHRQSRTLMLVDGSPSSLNVETMELLGDRWNTALASAAAIGYRRFSEFEKFLGIPPTVLSARLRRFVELDILAVRELAGGGGRSEHRLTSKGLFLITVLMQIVRWSDENVDTEEATIEIVHNACGRKVLAELMCGHCGEKLRRSEVEFPLLDR
jgi:DNA-binding HxlR family transcriptional regulator